MKKLYIIAIMILLSANLVNSQILVSPHPVTEYSGPDSLKLTALLTITNNGSQTLDVACERYQVNTAPSHFSYFCWVVCYDPTVSLSPTPIQVAPGASITNFEGWMGSGNTAGFDTVTYRFYDIHGNSDTLYMTFTYEFIGTTGINELMKSKYSMNISGSNPANTFTEINFKSTGSNNSRIVISNLLGSKIKEFPLDKTSGSIIVPVAELNSGIYLCSLYVDGMIMNSKKLIVSHN